MVNEKKEVKIVGMHCPNCVKAIELSLTELDGVDNAKASLEDKNVIIDYDRGKVSDEDIQDAVEEAGFSLE
ncbi:heavy-metal-associated domain-containing protein [uncultured Methanobrevibacter sp.]|uniref:heavy-metal-associated domain-containing protein n=1 Tax=uncultured Methanobrevibacter sp. TaxID=253161 RepID=UPI0025E67037|nr:heavy-metal-associated domain-containing protein [uncultured Methanobrevibacter sp.]